MRTAAPVLKARPLKSHPAGRVLVGLAASLLAMACSDSTSPSRAARDPQAVASPVLQLLTTSKYSEVALGLHEPPSYDPARATEDRRSVGDHLGFLFGELGTMSAPRLSTEPLRFYKVSLAGGDLPYWQSLRNMGIDAELTYHVSYSKLGPGILYLTFIRANSEWQLRSIEPGLEMRTRGARETMLRIGRAFFAKVNPPVDHQALNRMLESMFPPEVEQPTR